MCRLHLWTLKEGITALSICEIILLKCLGEKGSEKIDDVLVRFEEETLKYGFIGRSLFINTLKSLKLQGFISLRRVKPTIIKVELNKHLKEKHNLPEILKKEIEKRTDGLKPEVFRKILDATELLSVKENDYVRLDKLKNALQRCGVSEKEFNKALKKLLEWGFIYKLSPNLIKTVKPP